MGQHQFEQQQQQQLQVKLYSSFRNEDNVLGSNGKKIRERKKQTNKHIGNKGIEQEVEEAKGRLRNEIKREKKTTWDLNDAEQIVEYHKSIKTNRYRGGNAMKCVCVCSFSVICQYIYRASERKKTEEDW